MKQLGITSGCGGGAYCPNDPVTRSQMAVFIMRGAFNVLLPAGTPVVAAVTPAIGALNQNVRVFLYGLNTHWVSGAQVDAGAGITTSAVNVINPTTLIVTLSVGATTSFGPRSITVTSGAEEATLPNGFKVQ